MKKKLYLLITFFLTIFMFLTVKVNALGTSSISMWASANTVVVGNYVTFTVDLSSGNGGKFSTWSYTMSCSSNLVWQSGDKANETAGVASSPLNYKRFTFTYKSTSSGTGSCTFKIHSLPDYNDASIGEMGGTRTKSVSMNIITQAQLEASYSKNNNLSNLSVEGYTLSPTFNKNTLEYSVELPNGVTKIKINAGKEDGTASISGTGERNVTEGKNKLEIKVTAQNGSVKTYIINATVKELDPIIVSVNNEQYNVVRKKSEITAPNDTFKEKEIKINDLEVPAFGNDKLGYTLVGLKNNEGVIELYIYNEKENTYIKYEEYTFKSSIIGILDDNSKIPEGYIKAKVKINDKDVTAYKVKNSSRFCLFYGVNVETGEKNIYVYDEKEKTIQRYNDNEIISIYEKDYEEKESLYQYIIIGLGSLLIITYLVLLICLITSSNKKKKQKMKKMSKKRKHTILDEDEEVTNTNKDDE